MFPKFMDHPAFGYLAGPKINHAHGERGWSATFVIGGDALALKLRAGEADVSVFRAGDSRRISASTLPELEKRCDEFLRVYDAEIANAPKSAA
jgi:hypothetical protein